MYECPLIVTQVVTSDFQVNDALALMKPVFQVNDALALVKPSKETKHNNALFEVMSFLFIILFWLNLLFEYSKL